MIQIDEYEELYQEIPNFIRNTASQQLNESGVSTKRSHPNAIPLLVSRIDLSSQ